MNWFLFKLYFSCPAGYDRGIKPRMDAVPLRPFCLHTRRKSLKNPKLHRDRHNRHTTMGILHPRIQHSSPIVSESQQNPPSLPFFLLLSPRIHTGWMSHKQQAGRTWLEMTRRSQISQEHVQTEPKTHFFEEFGWAMVESWARREEKGQVMLLFQFSSSSSPSLTCRKDVERKEMTKEETETHQFYASLSSPPF